MNHCFRHSSRVLDNPFALHKYPELLPSLNDLQEENQTGQDTIVVLCVQKQDEDY